MTIHLPEDLAKSLRAEVLQGNFASEDEVVAAAVRDYLRRKGSQGHQSAPARDNAGQGGAQAEPSAQEIQRRLFEAGIVSEIKPPIDDVRPYANRKAVPIKGEPLSETVIRERR